LHPLHDILGQKEELLDGGNMGVAAYLAEAMKPM
jgi:hypothetical protein